MGEAVHLKVVKVVRFVITGLNSEVEFVKQVKLLLKAE